MRGKVSIVTGASRGIGRAIALRLAREGWTIVAAATNAGLLDRLIEEIEAAGGKAAALAQDLRSPDAPADLADFAISRYGRIDLVVNCAGATKRGDFLELSDEDWMDGYALKFFGAMRLTRSAWPQLRQHQGAV